MVSVFRSRQVVVALAASLVATAVATPRADAQQFALEEATIPQVHAALEAGTLTCRALVQGYLARIEAYDKRGPALNAIQTVNPRALAVADSLDAVQRRGGPRGPLHCVPVLLKDQVETKGLTTTYGSAVFKDYVPERDATIVERLQGAGAIILAKATMGELAQRYVGSAAGIIRNAYDPTRNPSGSSGGTASGVAANFGLVGIGEDTGGSIRGPAAVSNLVGLRPTLPLVSRFGMMPANPTQDTMGPMTRSVADAARVLDVIAGYDPRDPVTAYSVGAMPASYTEGLSREALRGARIGVLRISRDSATDSLKVEFAKVSPLFEAALADLRAQGALLVDSLRVPMVPGRSGNDFETEEATDAYLRELPGAPVRSLSEILLSGSVNPWRARSLVGYLGRSTRDPGYGALMQYREALRIAVLNLMAQHQLDALVYATYDAAAQRIADDVLTNPRPRDGYGLGDNRGLSATLAWPALSVPMGFTVDGQPAGLELLGRPFSDARLLAYAFAYEQATQHRRPPETAPPLRRRR